MEAKPKEEYGKRSIHDRRNPYRRPSALGVPARHQWNETEYDQKYVEKRGETEVYSRMEDNIHLNGGVSGSSETQVSYSAKSVNRSRVSRPNDNFEYDGLDFRDGTENNEYQLYDRGHAENQPRPEDNLRLEGGAEGISETRDIYSPKEATREPVNRRARDSNLQYDGLDFDEGSTNQQYMRGMTPEPPVRYRATENLRPLEGSIGIETETNDQFSPKYGRRAGNMKREDVIKPNGLDFEDGTENETYLRDMKIEQPLKYKMGTNLKTLDGKLEGPSETSEKYQPKYGRRAEKARLKTAVKSTGLDFDNGTENDKYMRDMKPGKPVRYRMSGNLRALDGKFSGQTETVEEFNEKELGLREKLNKYARESNIKSEGLDFRNDTENHEYLKNMQIPSPTRFTSLDNLTLLKGKLNESTEYTGRYTLTARRGTSRVRPAIDQDLMTPYGDLASHAVRLGDRIRYQVAA